MEDERFSLKAYLAGGDLERFSRELNNEETIRKYEECGFLRCEDECQGVDADDMATLRQERFLACNAEGLNALDVAVEQEEYWLALQIVGLMTPEALCERSNGQESIIDSYLFGNGQDVMKRCCGALLVRAAPLDTLINAEELLQDLIHAFATKAAIALIHRLPMEEICRPGGLGRTPLILAVLKERIDIALHLIETVPVEELLKAEDYGTNALHYAFACRSSWLPALRIAERLLDAGMSEALLHRKGDEGDTCLHVLAYSCNWVRLEDREEFAIASSPRSPSSDEYDLEGYDADVRLLRLLLGALDPTDSLELDNNGTSWVHVAAERGVAWFVAMVLDFFPALNCHRDAKGRCLTDICPGAMRGRTKSAALIPCCDDI